MMITGLGLVTLSVYGGVHDAVLDLHVSAEVALQVELAGAVRTLEGLAASVEVHVAEEVVHSVERLSAHLPEKGESRQHPCFKEKKRVLPAFIFSFSDKTADILRQEVWRHGVGAEMLRGAVSGSRSHVTCFALKGDSLPTNLALERLDRQVDDHVRFERLLLDKRLEADVALEGPHAGMDQHVSLQVGGQRELSGADVALEFFHTLRNAERAGAF